MQVLQLYKTVILQQLMLQANNNRAASATRAALKVTHAHGEWGNYD